MTHRSITRVWCDLVTYPEAMKSYNARLLDTLTEVFPISDMYEDRYSAISDWIDSAESRGLLTNREYMALRSDLAGCL